ncbi:hypothetical protein CSPHI_11120 [Corynebacterium sphenisci DSM 44792]|uniref:Fe/B12 periplasmic-binding domain-containing protein n=1 Tax=Corynebacterium sphenisci DSM 44792 TaxID=1437874 RepID=A0A1L7CZX0_9CORY|nr:iron-siderophore ABC transporter substrate-binding protein [Corynebacterium sphenisci]APT91436.1 hypothetical protein CSPHI_11120 [Corynebacterium sphenisci DSM 44792]
MRIGTRIAAAGAALMLACGPGLAGCSPDETGKAQETSAAAGVEDGAFPVTIEHAFGETTLEQAPTRVVALGATDVDPLLALGVTPVGVAEWHSDEPLAWQKNADTGEQPAFNIPSGENADEKIAALEPDLIVAQWAGLEQADYDKLSQIAPVVPYAEEYPDWSQPWDVTTERIGRAVGRPKAAKELVEEVKGKFEGIRERHPEWQEMSAVAGLYEEENGQLSMLTTLDPRGAFFGKLGFRMSPEVDAMVGDNVWADISLEQASVVDEDVFFLYSDSDESFMAQPVLAGLDVAKKGHVIPLGLLAADDPMLAEAFEWQSVLSLNYLLDGIEEPLAEALAE